jgi:hypothetical protein
VAAGVPGSAHGVRKIAATRAANNGATEAELMALFGWTDSKMAALYTRGRSGLQDDPSEKSRFAELFSLLPPWCSSIIGPTDPNQLQFHV